MTNIATYDQARALAHALKTFGIVAKDETFDMRTSGIYIPRWLGYSKIPHRYDPDTKVANWYFFLRFSSGQQDINVGEALDFSSNALTGEISHQSILSAAAVESFANIDSIVKKIKSAVRVIPIPQ
jgi:hypothetical protein